MSRTRLRSASKVTVRKWRERPLILTFMESAVAQSFTRSVSLGIVSANGARLWCIAELHSADADHNPTAAFPSKKNSDESGDLDFHLLDFVDDIAVAGMLAQAAEVGIASQPFEIAIAEAE